MLATFRYYAAAALRHCYSLFRHIISYITLLLSTILITPPMLPLLPCCCLMRFFAIFFRRLSMLIRAFAFFYAVFCHSLPAAAS